MLKGVSEVKLKEIFTKENSEKYFKRFAQFCHYKINDYMLAQFLAAKVVSIKRSTGNNWWQLEIQIIGAEYHFKQYGYDTLTCFTAIDEPIEVGSIIYAFFSFKYIKLYEDITVLSVQIPNGYTTYWEYECQYFDPCIINMTVSLNNFLKIGKNLYLSETYVGDSGKEPLLKIEDSYKTIMTKEDLDSEKEWSLYQLNNLLHDIGIVPEKEISTIHISGNGSLIETKNKDKRLMIKNEPKLYFLVNNNGFARFVNSKQILIRKGAEKLYKETYGDSLIKLVNKKAEDFLNNKFKLIRTSNNNTIMFKLLRVRPELVLDERQPKGVRKTIDMFVLLNSETHQPVGNSLYYEDFKKSKYTYKEIRGKIDELYKS